MPTTTLKNNIEFIWSHFFKRPKGYVFRVTEDFSVAGYKLTMSTKDYAVGAVISRKDAMDAKSIEHVIKSMMEKIDEAGPINIPVAELRKKLVGEPPEHAEFSSKVIARYGVGWSDWRSHVGHSHTS